MLRYLTAGESHGAALAGILEGMPSGLKMDTNFINNQLKRRQCGYGRGQRMKIEKDRVKILSGLRKGLTIGSPICFLIENRDFSIDQLPAVKNPRPGHADLAGALKYGQKDIRNVLERASARNTATQVAIGAMTKVLLDGFDIDIFSHVIMIGKISADIHGKSIPAIKRICSNSRLNCADSKAGQLMIKQIDNAKKLKDSLGGIFEVVITGLPPGLGSFMHYDRRLDGRLAFALMSMPAIKGVEVGLGFMSSLLYGSSVHDAIYYSKNKGFYRKTNNAGGLEGGVTNGQPIILRASMKPISTLPRPIDSVNIVTKSKVKAAVERADVCAVPAAGVVGEAVCAFEIANAFLEKFGGDSLGETKRNYNGYLKQIKNF